MAAAQLRGYWSPFAESPSPRHYGETANDDGRAAFETLRGKPFPLDLPGAEGSVGGEASPYGFDLGITYPRVPAAKLVAASSKALEQWRRAGLARLGRRVDGNPVAPEQAELRDRLRGAAHHRPGVS